MKTEQAGQMFDKSEKRRVFRTQQVQQMFDKSESKELLEQNR